MVPAPAKSDAQATRELAAYRSRSWNSLGRYRRRYFCSHASRLLIPAMKLSYFPDTDSLYIDLSARPSTESQEVSEGVVLDYDAEGNLVGIDIDHASKKLDLRELVTTRIPLRSKSVNSPCRADLLASPKSLEAGYTKASAPAEARRRINSQLIFGSSPPAPLTSDFSFQRFSVSAFMSRRSLSVGGSAFPH